MTTRRRLLVSGLLAWTALVIGAVPSAWAGPDDEGPGRDQPSCVAFSPDGLKFVTTSGSDVRLLDATDGKEIRRFSGHTERVFDAVFSPDGKRLLTGGGSQYDMGVIPTDTTARLWDVETGRELRRFPHGAFVYTVAFSPDGKRFLTVSREFKARVWDSATGAELLSLPVMIDDFRPDGFLPQLSPASFSPDGHTVLTRGFRHVDLWDAETGEKRRRLDGPESTITSAVFSPDGRSVLASSFDRTARTWNASTGATLNVFRGHSGSVVSAAFDATGLRVFTASKDSTARIWDAVTGAELRRLTEPGLVDHATPSPDGKRVLTAWESGPDGPQRGGETLWDAEDGRVLKRFPTRSNSASAVFSPDGTKILIPSDPASLWDARTGEIIRKFR